MESTPVIQIVDDVPANIGLLLDALSRDYRLLVAESGESCLEQLPHAVPDLFLLDVRMPGMDGFALFEHLRAEPRWRKIPVIFMTAVDEPSEKVRALEQGAVDYVTKPVHIPEVLARVKTHLQLLQLQRTLRAQNEELETEVCMRRETEEHLRHSLEQAVAATDKAGRLLFVTRKGEYLLSRYYGPLVERRITGVFQEQLRQAREAGRREWTFPHEDGRGSLEVRIYEGPAGQERTLFYLEENGVAALAPLRKLGLSPRECEVLWWVAEGKSYPEIATILEASVRTIQKHAENLLRKLGVESRAAAMRLALELLAGR